MIIAIKTLRKVPASKPSICLTFDDGPHSVYTPKILEALTKYHSQATWFILGKQAQTRLSLLEDIFKEGNEIGVHSYEHVNLTQLSPHQVFSQLDRTRQLIEGTAGKSWPYFRPPNGAFNESVLQTAGKMGFAWNVLWSVDPRDYQSSTPQIVNRILKDIFPGAIIILHEVTASTALAVPIVLKTINQLGYQAVTLTSLLELGESE
jgi:peptidoglycan/xylan/chitin deacetylase (PgdA/CDA1 family)